MSGPINPPGPLDPSWQSLLPVAYGVPQPVVRIPERGGLSASAGADVFPVDEELEIDGVVLQEDLVRALGQDVAISVATVDGARELTIADPSTGRALPVNSAVVARVLAEHTPAETGRERFLREYDAAATVEAKLDTVRDFIARQVDDEQRSRFLARRARGQSVDSRTAEPAGRPPRSPVPPRVTSRNPWTQRIQRGEG